MALYKHSPLADLERHRDRLIAQMQNLGQLRYHEPSNQHGDARISLADLFVSIGADLREVRAAIKRHTDTIGPAPVPATADELAGA